MTGLASLTVLETLQNIQNERFGYSPMSVWNDNPPNPVPNEKSPIERQTASIEEQNAAKKQEYKKKFETELDELSKELLDIQNYVKKFDGLPWERGRKVQVGTVPQAANDKKDDKVRESGLSEFFGFTGSSFLAAVGIGLFGRPEDCSWVYYGIIMAAGSLVVFSSLSKLIRHFFFR